MEDRYHWYPGHMAKALAGIKKDISAVDIVIEVVDARAPESTGNPNLKKLARGKGHILILNKADMADPHKTTGWKEFYKSRGMSACSINAKRQSDLSLISELVREEMEKKASLKERTYKKTPRIMVCGIPNVGKSTIINALVGSRSAKTGNRPGVTTGKQWIKSEQLGELLDTPGVLYVKPVSEEAGERLALLGSLNDNNLSIQDLAFDFLKWMYRKYPGFIQAKYDVKECEDPLETFDLIGTRMGAIKRGGLIDYERAAKIIIDDFRNNRLGRISLEEAKDYEA